MPVCVFLSVICERQDLPGNIALALGVDEVASLGPCHKQKEW